MRVRDEQGETHTTTCTYCGAEDVTDGPVPASDDTAAWERLAVEHEPGCEWIATRAHRYDVRLVTL